MDLIIITTFLLSMYHYVLQSAIIPSLRSGLRYEAFAVRDQLRELKMRHPEELPDPVFHSLQDSVNFIISDVWQISVGGLVRAHRAYHQHPEIRRRVTEKIQALDACKLEEIKQLRRVMLRISAKAMLVNMAGWYIYILPVFAVLLFLGQFKQLVRMILATPPATRNTVVLPEHSLA